MSTFSSLSDFVNTITERFNVPRRSVSSEGVDKSIVLESLIDTGTFSVENNEAALAGMQEIADGAVSEMGGLLEQAELAKNLAFGMAASKNSGGFAMQIAALQDADNQIRAQVDSFWKGRNVLWIGTSIPATGYPEIACTKIGAVSNNQALGSSMLRVARKNGTVAGIPFTSFYRSLMKTIAECNYIIANWNNTTGTSIGAAPTTWTATFATQTSNFTVAFYTLLSGAPSNINSIESGTLTYADVMKGASYENRVLPFLAGTRVNSIGQTVGDGLNNGVSSS
jgi:hypothetical protein